MASASRAIEPANYPKSGTLKAVREEVMRIMFAKEASNSRVDRSARSSLVVNLEYYARPRSRIRAQMSRDDNNNTDDNKTQDNRDILGVIGSVVRLIPGVR